MSRTMDGILRSILQVLAGFTTGQTFIYLLQKLKSSPTPSLVETTDFSSTMNHTGEEEGDSDVQPLVKYILMRLPASSCSRMTATFKARVQATPGLEGG